MTDAINYCKDFKLNEEANGSKGNKYGYYNNMATGDINFNLIADSIKKFNAIFINQRNVLSNALSN